MSESAPAPTTPSVHSDTDPADPAHTSPQSLGRAVYDRRSEYVRTHRMRIKIGTWNVAACPGTDKDLAAWFIEGKGVDASLSVAKPHRTAAVDYPASDDDDDAVRLMGTGQSIGLYVLGLQEIVDLGLATEAYNRMHADYSPMDKWRAALEAALPAGYSLVSAEQMSGLALLIYASAEVAPTVSDVRTAQVGTGLLGYMGNKGAISTRVVLGETTRMVFVNSHLASGADQTYADRRCWDISQVLSRTQFDPVPRAGVVEDEPEKIGDEDFAFWFGDLNFRVDGLPGDDIRRLLRLHTRGEYDVSQRSRRRSSSTLEEGVIVMKSSSDGAEDVVVTDRSTSPSPDMSLAETDVTLLPDPDHFLRRHDDSGDDSSNGYGDGNDNDDNDDDDFKPDPHQDPASLQATLDSLLPHDQLRRMMAADKVLHEGWREAPITFLPTYKYDVGTVGLFDSSEKKRAPSWCDRVLYRTRRDLDSYRERVREEEEARRRDEEMKARGLDEDDDDDVLFSYDPEADGQKPDPAPVIEYDYDEYDEADDDPAEMTDAAIKEGSVDRIRVNMYASHQRTTSSDHKPVVSVFTLDYDAADPALKARVHAEVARELDRAENEGRPSVTVVVDPQNRGPARGKGGGGGGASGSEVAVDFGDLAFLAKQTCSLTVANTGGVPATFSFVDRPSVNDDGSTPPRWLSSTMVSPGSEGEDGPGDGGAGGSKDLGWGELTVQPGETANLLLEALVDDPALAQSLNYARSTLDDVLVLRVEGGRDHFIPVRAAWLPTSFSRSVEELIRVPPGRGGIRAFISSSSTGDEERDEEEEDERGGGGGSSRRIPPGAIPSDMPVHSAAPRELLSLTSALESLLERAVADENMLPDCAIPRTDETWPFSGPSRSTIPPATRASALASLASALDTDSPLLPSLPPTLPAVQTILLLSDLLLLFLRSLTDGILPAHLLPLLPPVPTSSSPSDLSDVRASTLDILSSAASPYHNVSFVFLAATLSRVIETVPRSSETKGRLSRVLRVGGGGGGGDEGAARARDKVAGVFAGAVFRVGKKDEERARGLLAMFLRRE